MVLSISFTETGQISKILAKPGTLGVLGYRQIRINSGLFWAIEPREKISNFRTPDLIIDRIP
jgi:hypothetical protein